MAVKPVDKMDDSGQGGLDPQKLAHFLNMFQHPEVYLPTSTDVVNCCNDIAVWLGSITVPEGQNNTDEFMAFLNEVQLTINAYLSTANPKLQKEVTGAIRNVIYPMIINPTGPPMKGICVMLNILQDEAVEWMVEEGNSGGVQGTTDLKNMMQSLFRWLYAFDVLPVSNTIVLMFIKKLEEKKRWDVLTDVSLQEITKLFEALLGPTDIRESVAPVLFHILGAMRQHPLIVDKIARHLEFVLENLAWDSSQLSRQLLQTVVDLTARLINEQEPQKKEKYSNIVTVLDSHMTSNSCHYLQLEPWSQGAQPGSMSPRPRPRPRNGLRNQGNMCYFNSVMQALLLNKTFTRHVILKMHNVPVWSTVSRLFARMLYSSGQSLDVRDFYKALKPQHFNEGHQHDSSEFLMHLMNNLSVLDHSKTPKAIEGSSGLQGELDSYTSDESLDNSDEVAQSSSSGAQKRLSEKNRGGSSTKRRKEVHGEPDSFIQTTFGGICVTSITCLHCRSNSRRQDTFREIQLAIPDKQNLVKDEYTVQFLFNYYCKTEILTGDNAYRCSMCNQLTDAEKSIQLKKLPKYLLIVLKRFNYDAKMKEHTKLMHRIRLNRVLSVGSNNTEKSSYKLYGTVIHAGVHADMGHYYTVAEENGHWYRYNDEVVESVDEKELLRLNHGSETPYLLFYRRVDFEEEPHPDISELPEALLDHLHTYEKQQTNRHRHATRASTGHASIRPVYT